MRLGEPRYIIFMIHEMITVVNIQTGGKILHTVVIHVFWYFLGWVFKEKKVILERLNFLGVQK